MVSTFSVPRVLYTPRLRQLIVHLRVVIKKKADCFAVYKTTKTKSIKIRTTVKIKQTIKKQGTKILYGFLI